MSTRRLRLEKLAPSIAFLSSHHAEEPLCRRLSERNPWTSSPRAPPVRGSERRAAEGPLGRRFVRSSGSGGAQALLCRTVGTECCERGSESRCRPLPPNGSPRVGPCSVEHTGARHADKLQLRSEMLPNSREFGHQKPNVARCDDRCSSTTTTPGRHMAFAATQTPLAGLDSRRKLVARPPSALAVASGGSISPKASPTFRV